jgi:hypothetical protein
LSLNRSQWSCNSFHLKKIMRKQVLIFPKEVKNLSDHLLVPVNVLKLHIIGLARK